MRSLNRGTFPGLLMPCPLPDQRALLLMVVLLLMTSTSAFADPNGHSIPPNIGAHAMQRSDAGVAAGHRRDSHGHDGSKSNHKRQASPQRPAISPEQAAQRARKHFGGRVLNVVLEQGPGGPYYRVKLLERGRVRVVDIDARR